MSRQYRRWHKKKEVTDQLFHHSGAMVCRSFRPLLSSFSSRFHTRALALDFLTPCPVPPRHYYLISRLIRKGNGRWRACLLRLEIRRKSSRGKRARASSGGCEMISNVTRCAFLIKSLYCAFPGITSGASFIFLIYRRRKFSFFDLRDLSHSTFPSFDYPYFLAYPRLRILARCLSIFSRVSTQPWTLQGRIARGDTARNSLSKNSTPHVM